MTTWLTVRPSCWSALCLVCLEQRGLDPCLESRTRPLWTQGDTLPSFLPVQAPRGVPSFDGHGGCFGSCTFDISNLSLFTPKSPSATSQGPVPCCKASFLSSLPVPLPFLAPTQCGRDVGNDPLP